MVALVGFGIINDYSGCFLDLYGNESRKEVDKKFVINHTVDLSSFSS